MMPRITPNFFVCAFVGVTLAFQGGLAVAGNCPEPDPAQMAELSGKFLQLASPGPEHEMLAKFAGEWSAEASMWMEPGGDAMTTTNESTAEMILGGRFLRTVTTGSFMGMQVESISIFGFDRRHEQFTLIGFDTMGTYYITAAGTYDADSRTISLRGTDDDPIMGITQVYEFTVTLDDDDHYTVGLTFECPTFGADGPHKLLEVKHTREDS